MQGFERKMIVKLTTGTLHYSLVPGPSYSSEGTLALNELWAVSLFCQSELPPLSIYITSSPVQLNRVYLGFIMWCQYIGQLLAMIVAPFSWLIRFCFASPAYKRRRPWKRCKPEMAFDGYVPVWISGSNTAKTSQNNETEGNRPLIQFITMLWEKFRA